ncbi:hypothetical protein D3C85_1343780 [compost metagenome]
MGHRHHVELDHRVEAIQVGIQQATADGHARVVHQQADRSVAAQPLRHAAQIGLVGQVGLHHLHLYPSLLTQLRRQGFQARLVTGNQQQVVAPLRQAPGISGTDAGGRAGDQGNALVLLFAHGSVSRGRARDSSDGLKLHS